MRKILNISPVLGLNNFGAIAYTKKDIAERTKLPQRTIHYYTDKGLVVPRISNPKGRGTTREYSSHNIYELLFIKELTDLGLNLKSIYSIMERLRDVDVDTLLKIEAILSNRNIDVDFPNTQLVYITIYNPANNPDISFNIYVRREHFHEIKPYLNMEKQIFYGLIKERERPEFYLGKDNHALIINHRIIYDKTIKLYFEDLRS